MDKLKVQKKLENLKKFKEIIEISKFNVLQKLKKETKISNKSLDMAFLSKEIIDYGIKKYKIEFSSKLKISKTVWVFISPNKEILETNNSRLIKIIKDNFITGQDSLICLGNDAFKFANKTNFNVVYKAKNLHEEEIKLGRLLTKMIFNNSVTDIKFVINSSKVLKNIVHIYPIKNLKLNYKLVEKKNIEKKVFYPSLIEVISKLSSIYILKLSHSFVKEVTYFHLKEKLIKDQNSIKSIDKIISGLNQNIKKEKSKKETEEIIFVTQLAKKGRND